MKTMRGVARLIGGLVGLTLYANAGAAMFGDGTFAAALACHEGGSQ